MADAKQQPSHYRYYVLVILLTVSAFNFVDRLALGVMLQDIKQDLLLSDTQLGFLTGIAFALFYSVMGIPIARWADRGNRVRIIGITAAIWSVAVGACGLAVSFAQLLLIRIGVAVGEAGCAPPAMSLLADYFAREERPRANAIYALGGPLSSVIGFFAAGWLSQQLGWRMTFVVLGFPGLMIALLAYFTIREPREVQQQKVADAELDQADSRETLADVCTVLLRNPSFVRLLVCMSVVFFFLYGILQWLPSFFIRSHGLSTFEVGAWFASAFGIGGILGLYLGGEWSSRIAANNERLQLRLVAAAIALASVGSIPIYLLQSYQIAFVFLGLHVVFLNVCNGPLLGTMQTLVPDRMRAVAFSFVYLFANLFGLGLGPLAAGALSDALRPALSDESLRYALLIMTPGYLVAAWQAFRASKSVMADLANADATTGAIASGMPDRRLTIGA